MYSKVLKDSTASTKAWESRRRSTTANQKETHKLIQNAAAKNPAYPTVGNTGLTAGEYKKATNHLSKAIGNAAETEGKAIDAAASKSGLTHHANTLLKGTGAEFNAYDGEGGTLMTTNASHAKMVANAKAKGYHYMESKDVVGDPTLESEGSETFKIPSKFSFAHPDGSSIHVSHNRDHGDYAAMDLDFKKGKPAKKTDTDHIGSVAASLGIV